MKMAKILIRLRTFEIFKNSLKQKELKYCLKQMKQVMALQVLQLKILMVIPFL